MTCALDDQALAQQLTRFERIGRHAVWARRFASELTVVLDAGLDDALLRETLTIEKACCPFFALIWNDSTRELTIAAREHHEPVLDRIAQALGHEPAVA